MNERTEALASMLRIHRAMSPKESITLNAYQIPLILDVFDQCEELMVQNAELSAQVLEAERNARDAWDAYMAVLGDDEQ